MNIQHKRVNHSSHQWVLACSWHDCQLALQGPIMFQVKNKQDSYPSFTNTAEGGKMFRTKLSTA